MLPLIYTLLLGLLAACFVEMGVHTFLPDPEPKWDGIRLGPDDSPELRAKRNREGEEYRRKAERRAVIHYILSLIGATILAMISLVFKQPMGILADGILLGAVFTLGSGTVFGITGGGKLARFSVVTVSLLVTLFLGWQVFLPHAR